MLELYIHIPFCVRKCNYCDFLSMPQSEEVRERYVKALCREISLQGRKRKEKGLSREVSTLFFGGGTPSLLTEEQIARIAKEIRESFDVQEDAEWTIEANPGTVDREKLLAYREVGINRISIGLQSTDDRELELLGRIHTYEEFLESYEMARACGFTNINIDLISAIPGQTLETYERGLRKILALEPEHISAYSLIVEEGTPFYALYGEEGTCTEALPSEEEERKMYERTEELLLEAGYMRYEISNYAKDGYACRHNLGYWEGTEYLGLGLGASSLLSHVRYRNEEKLEMYLISLEEPEAKVEDIRQVDQVLTKEEEREEFFFLGLRKMAGVSKREYECRFGEKMEEVYGENLRRLIEQGLLREEKEHICLTGQGIDVSNYVFVELLNIVE